MPRPSRSYLITVAFAALMALDSCTPKVVSTSSPKLTPVPGAIANDPWVLACNDPEATTPALLWNGLMGVRLDRRGLSPNETGRSTFYIEAYEHSDEEKILPKAGVLSERLFVGDEQLVPQRDEPYLQTLDMRTGTLTTTWTQETPTAGRLTVSVQTILHPLRRTIGARIKIEAERKITIQRVRQPESKVVPFVQENETREITVFAVLPTEVVNHRQSSSDRAPASPVIVEPGRPAQIDLVRQVAVGHATSSVLVMPKPESYDEMRQDAEREFRNMWKTDIEIDGPTEDQRAIRSFLFYLRTAVHHTSKRAPSPMGLSGDAYGGHIFWDADIWMFPALALLDPKRAATIPRYRIAMRQMAEANSRQFNRAQLALRYPWESSVTGVETCRAEMVKEEHINGSVLWMLNQAASLGLAAPLEVRRVGLGAANYYVRRSSQLPNGAIGIRATVSPDEFKTVDNDLYTNLLAQWTIDKYGNEMQRPRAKWLSAYAPEGPPATPGSGDLPRFHLPRDDTGFLTYDNDGLRTYKQAAAVLAIFPLQYPPAEQQARVMLDRFQHKITPNGPAMSDSVHALIEARFGDPDAAHDTWQKSWKSFTNHPLMLFSEKRRSERTYFTTGAAGCLSTVIYGFVGFKIGGSPPANPAWRAELRGGDVLTLQPKLPKLWKAVRLKNFVLLGKRYNLTVTHTNFELSEGG